MTRICTIKEMSAQFYDFPSFEAVFGEILKDKAYLVCIMIPDNIVEENLSAAYIKAVSTMAGFEVHPPARDWGWDHLLAEVEEVDGEIGDTGWHIRIQAKACKNTRDLGDKIAYDLKNKARNALVKRDPKCPTPKILVVLCLERDKADWIIQDIDKLILKKCAFWTYLEGTPPSTDDPNSTTVIHIPKKNIFSPEAIVRIMECVKARGDLHGLSD